MLYGISPSLNGARREISTLGFVVEKYLRNRQIDEPFLNIMELKLNMVVID
jgi:hypothetical protein